MVVDNSDLVPSTAVITDHSYSTDEHLCGRTWLNDNRTQLLDEVHVFRGAHLAVDPELSEYIIRAKITKNLHNMFI